eukprot:TRINITY_DN2486_c0_g1_i4.p1 TRINITY_DN2486_c0_g1~~TRINITY_DN2486_c0_g1_i4.p1  ORF type:complete len:333 (+),score=51.67 TRINITY_DN2486_c0_g1_i4:193-1191(+)
MVAFLPTPRVQYVSILECQHVTFSLFKGRRKSGWIINRLADPNEDHFPQRHSQIKELDAKTSYDKIRTNQNQNQLKYLKKGKNKENQTEEEGGIGGWYASVGVVGGIAVLIGLGYLLQDQIKTFLEVFIHVVENWGIWGILSYGVVYTGLEVLAVPAIPLTMTAGVIFGILPGTIVVSIAGTIAATISFLIARYVARERVMKIVGTNSKLAAIDRAIAKDGFSVVVLLRLSPLLPLAISNYFYGLTSVDLTSYVLGSWLGMLPGTFAYVFAGSASRNVFLEGQAGSGLAWWQIALGIGSTVLALLYVGRVAKRALEKYEREEETEQQEQTRI